MERFTRALQWLVATGGLWTATYYGAFGGVEWAANLTRFAVWVFVLPWFVMLAFVAVDIKNKATGKTLTRPSASDAAYVCAISATAVPRWLDRLIDIALILTMVSAGWFITALALTLAFVFALAAVEIADDAVAAMDKEG